MYLIIGKDPATETLLYDKRNSELWALVKSCAGHSLNVLNPGDKPEQWKVTPINWVHWLREKDYSVPAELLTTLFPPSPIITPEQKIAPAQQAREKKKRDRHKALKAFVLDTIERAKSKSIAWDSQSISVTKSDFLKVFHAQYPQIGKFTMDTFNHDIAEIGLKFKAGTKSNLNNVLEQIYS